MDRKNKTSGIYSITNTVNGKVYVGSAKCVANRWKEHLKQMRAGNHHSLPLRRAVAKYGVESFVFSILEECGLDELISREQHYLDTMLPEYNVCKIAGNTLGIKHTDAQKKANSERCKKQRSTPEWKAAQSARIKHVFADPEFRKEMAAKVRERMKSIPREVLQARYTAEAREKISESQIRVAPTYVIRGEALRLTEIVEKYGVSRSLFKSRIDSGMTADEAATTPVDARRTQSGSKVHEYDGKLYNLRELAEFSTCSKVALFRRIKSGMSVKDAVEMTPEQAELRRRELIKKGMQS